MRKRINEIRMPQYTQVNEKPWHGRILDGFTTGQKDYIRRLFAPYFGEGAVGSGMSHTLSEGVRKSERKYSRVFRGV